MAALQDRAPHSRLLFAGSTICTTETRGQRSPSDWSPLESDSRGPTNPSFAQQKIAHNSQNTSKLPKIQGKFKKKSENTNIQLSIQNTSRAQKIITVPLGLSEYI
jgi:hypothetical protein